MPKAHKQLDSIRQRARAGFSVGSLAEAFSLYKQILSVKGKDLEALQMLGTIAHRAAHLEEAGGYFKRALKLDRTNPELPYQMGAVLLDQGKAEEALEWLLKAVRLRSGFFEPWVLIGNIYAFGGDLGRAIDAYRNAIKAKPEHPVPFNNLGNVLADRGDFEAAYSNWAKALALKPDYASAHSNMLVCMNYQHDNEPSEVLARHRAWAERHLAGVRLRDDFTRASESVKKIRVAYLSPDFREHSVAYFAAPIIEQHDRSAFEVYLYSNVARPDARTEWFREKADRFIDISGLSDDEAAKRIEADRIDILVDLAGHTSGNRLAVFGRKPAPVQVAYLGYPNSTGLEQMDYRLTDGFADRIEVSQPFYTERLVSLEAGFLCFEPPADVPEVQPPPCLEKGYITFGSFNYTAKISDETIAVWARILTELPESKLLMKYRSFSDEGTRAYFSRRFEREGVDAGRIRFMGLTPSKAEHLSAYSEVDIALDTFPYNGTTTTCDTLWMGVPVIVLEGDVHAARVGFSLLKRVGLEECIATSHVEYVQRALDLASDRDWLTRQRQKMRERVAGSQLCDKKGFVRELERVYRLFCEGAGG